MSAREQGAGRRRGWGGEGGGQGRGRGGEGGGRKKTGKEERTEGNTEMRGEVGELVEEGRDGT